ncbi:MAG: hypothetical protein IPO78_12910 [Saprospiraceae bacterium]|nr:hypothetical protein [Saprospiraceae bacterium]
MHRFINIFALLITILFTSCRKDEPSCETCHTGTFRCKINGVLWEPYCSPDPPFGCNALNIQFYSDTKWFGMTGKNDKDGKSFSMYIPNLKFNEANRLNDCGFSDYTRPASCISYDIDTSKNNELVIIEYVSSSNKCNFFK